MQHSVGAMLHFTEEAVEVLHRAHEAATRLNPDAKIRVSRIGERVSIDLADSPGDGDETIDADGITVYVAEGIEGTLGVSEEHDHLQLVD